MAFTFQYVNTHQRRNYVLTFTILALKTDAQQVQITDTDISVRAENHVFISVMTKGYVKAVTFAYVVTDSTTGCN